MTGLQLSELSKALNDVQFLESVTHIYPFRTHRPSFFLDLNSPGIIDSQSSNPLHRSHCIVMFFFVNSSSVKSAHQNLF